MGALHYYNEKTGQIRKMGLGGATPDTILVTAGYNTHEVLTKSGKWNAPVSGWFKITAIGGGGGGGRSSTTVGGFAGCSGGISIGYLHFEKGNSANYTIGAGGKRASNNVSATRGGNTTFGDIIAGGGGFGHSPGTSFQDSIAGGSSNCGLVGFSGTASFYGGTYNSHGGTGGGFGGGGGHPTKALKSATGYGGGGAGGEYNSITGQEDGEMDIRDVL